MIIMYDWERSEIWMKFPIRKRYVGINIAVNGDYSLLSIGSPDALPRRVPDCIFALGKVILELRRNWIAVQNRDVWVYFELLPHLDERISNSPHLRAKGFRTDLDRNTYCAGNQVVTIFTSFGAFRMQIYPGYNTQPRKQDAQLARC